MERRAQNIVVGSLLGDGWLEALSPTTGTSIYRVKYNDKSLGYLSWLREELQELQPSALKEKSENNQHYFYTKARQDIGEIRKLFYPNEGVKRVPATIGELLTDPISVAVWYQDDGTLDRRARYHWNVRLATYCFPYEDCVLLKEILKKNFGLEVSICRCAMRNKVYYQLYVPTKSMERFMEVVRPFIHENYAYKILARC